MAKKIGSGGTPPQGPKRTTKPPEASKSKGGQANAPVKAPSSQAASFARSASADTGKVREGLGADLNFDTQVAGGSRPRGPELNFDTQVAGGSRPRGPELNFDTQVAGGS
ncbi:MAG: hypothetical protein AB7S38_27330, partial [Vulcanimicrobiota bacterium]